MTRTAILLLATATLLAGCGRMTDLEPPEGASLPPAVYGQTTRPSAERLLETSSQARPRRSDEILTRSQRRADDYFDLPPGAEPNAAPAAAAPDATDPLVADPAEAAPAPAEPRDPR